MESLYTKNRSPWDKVKHEVDYLLRVATAGSEEARKIKKAKNVFEKVYESKTKNPTGEGGVRYALSQHNAAGAQFQYVYMKPFADQIVDYQNGNIRDDDALVVGTPPQGAEEDRACRTSDDYQSKAHWRCAKRDI